MCDRNQRWHEKSGILKKEFMNDDFELYVYKRCFV